jgi:hypothetical protein
MKKTMFLTLVILAILSMACTIGGVSVDVNRTEGSGVITKEERSVGDFSEIVLSGIGNLHIVQGAENKVVVEAEENIISKITTTVKGDKLVIGVEKGFNIIPTKEINYYITVQDITGIQMLGAGNVKADKIVTDKLNINLTGFGSMDITDLTATSLDVMISGAGDITVSGVADDQKVNITGAGNYHGEDLQSQTTSVIVSGVGNSDLWVEQELSVVISGGGNINYYGSPETNRTITGLGKLTSQGEHY